MSEIRLHFEGPYPVCSDSADVLDGCPHSKESGIYLWAVQMPTGRYRITYIGETSASFYRRIKDHVIQTLGGNYRICDPTAMGNGIQRIVWDGLWRKGTRDKLPEFLRRYAELVPLIKESLKTEVVFLAVLECHRRLKRRIEGALAEAHRACPEKASLLPEDIRYFRRRADEVPVAVQVSAEKEIEGLPSEIWA
ncbi:MAG: hypothetical protein WHT06_04515 [Desulfobacterales bacterium]